MGALVQARELSVGYHQKAVLEGLEFEVHAGELWALVGPNGSGKTTLLRTLLGLQDPVSGELGWHDDARIGYVPQRSRRDATLPSRAQDVVASGLDHGWSFLSPRRSRAREAVEAAMRETQTWELRRTPYAHLSEGQKQRVLMARALAQDVTVFVLDEPTSAMDMTAEHEVFELLERVRHARDMAVVLVSHHLTVVAEFATHVLLLDRECDMILAGTIEHVAEHGACRARYGRILSEGIARRDQHLCALADELDHAHSHDHSHHDHTHHHHEHHGHAS